MISARLKSSQAFFDSIDTYSIPEKLRQARSQFDRHGDHFLTPKNDGNLSTEISQNECQDEDDNFFATVTNSCGLFHMAFRRLLTPFLRRFSLRILPSPISETDKIDIESNIKPWIQLENQLIQSEDDVRFEGKPEVKSYQVTTDMGSMDVIEVNLPYKKTVFENFLTERRDLKSIVLNEKCASLIWIWSEKTRIILITESSQPDSWSLKQWYRKILSDMALTDSILIGHPYYWHPVVRRRLNRVIKHFKKLYQTLDKLEGSESSSTDPWQIDVDMIEAIPSDSDTEFEYCQDSTKIILTGSESQEENVINDIYLKWSDYSRKYSNKARLAANGDCSRKDNQRLEDFMTTLTEKIGPPPENAIEMSLGSQFRVEKLSRNISAISSASLNLKNQVPVHTRTSRKGKSIRQGSPSVSIASRPRYARRTKP